MHLAIRSAVEHDHASPACLESDDAARGLRDTAVSARAGLKRISIMVTSNDHGCYFAHNVVLSLDQAPSLAQAAGLLELYSKNSGPLTGRAGRDC